MVGWVGGWGELGGQSDFKDCFQQSKMTTVLTSIPVHGLRKQRVKNNSGYKKDEELECLTGSKLSCGLLKFVYKCSAVLRAVNYPCRNKFLPETRF
jgi:hypothetical protein